MRGQFELAIDEKVKNNVDYETADREKNVILLIKIVREIYTSVKETQYKPYQIILTLMEVMKFKHGNLSISEYYKQLIMKVKVVDNAGMDLSFPSLWHFISKTDYKADYDDITYNSVKRKISLTS